MNCSRFDELFSRKDPLLFLDPGKGSECIKTWFLDDNDREFLEFIQWVESRFLGKYKKHGEDKYRKAYVNVLDSVISCYDHNIDADAVAETSPIHYEIQRIEWKLCLYNRKYSGWKRESIIRNWLRICLNLGSNNHIEFYLEVSKHNREEEVKEIIFESDGKLREYFKKDIGPSYLQLILDWVLRRYNLKLASQLAFILIFGSDKSVWKKVSLICFPLLIILGLPALFIFFIHPNGNSFFTYMVIFLYFLLIFAFALSIFWNEFAKLLLPRLFGGIIVGYLPLLLAKDAWNMVLNMNMPTRIAVIALALGFSIFYMFIEIHNTLKDKWTSLKRASHILAVGFVESFCVGIIVSDLITKPIFPCLKGSLPAFFGYICPKVLCVYFPLALMIGIFVQIIWEEKPVTHPL